MTDRVEVNIGAGIETTRFECDAPIPRLMAVLACDGERSAAVGEVKSAHPTEDATTHHRGNGSCAVVDPGLVAALPLWLSARPKRSSDRERRQSSTRPVVRRIRGERFPA